MEAQSEASVQSLIMSANFDSAEVLQDGSESLQSLKHDHAMSVHDKNEG